MIRKTINITFLALTLFSAATRLIHLGGSALTELEAGIALGALNAGAPSVTIISAVYQNITAGLFFLFGETNFLARLPIALSGIFLIFSPFLFRKLIGLDRALVWAFLVSVSPLGVAASRNIDVVTLVLALSVLAVWALINEKKAFVGAIVGALILSGPEFWMILITFIVLWLVDDDGVLKNSFREKLLSYGSDKNRRSSFLLGLAVSLMVFGTGFLQNPTSITSIVSSAVAFVSSYSNVSIEGLITNVIAFPIYEPLLFLFLMIGGLLNGLKRENSRGANLVVAILWGALILRTGHIFALSIISFILAYIVSEWVSELLDTRLENPKESAAMTLFAFVVFIFAGFNLLSSMTVGLDQGQFLARLAIAFFSILLLLISAFLVAAGWTRQIAVSGSLIGLVFFTGLLNTSVFWKASGLFAEPTFELWQLNDPAINSGSILGPIQRINDRNHRAASDTIIEIVGLRSNALLWALRSYDLREFVDMKLSAGNTPFVVTGQEFDLDVMQGDFRGQNSYWSGNVVAEQAQLITFGRWLVFREAPINKNNLILWTNSNQFVDFQNQTSE